MHGQPLLGYRIGLVHTLQAVRRALEDALGRELFVPTMIEQMVDGYGMQIADPSTYRSMLTTNSALAGV